MIIEEARYENILVGGMSGISNLMSMSELSTPSSRAADPVTKIAEISGYWSNCSSAKAAAMASLLLSAATNLVLIPHQAVSPSPSDIRRKPDPTWTPNSRADIRCFRHTVGATMLSLSSSLAALSGARLSEDYSCLNSVIRERRLPS